MNDKPFSVVFVCTGNRFRSPLAAALMRQQTIGLPVEVGSVGTLDVGAAPVLQGAAAAADSLGLDLADHRAKHLAGSDLGSVDLVVGFERIHVATAVVEAGAQRSRSFTLPELVVLLEEDETVEPGGLEIGPAEIARGRVRRAAAGRTREVATDHAPELSDPLGLPLDQQRQTAERVRDLTMRLARELFG